MIGWLDCAAGASGDMLLGALVDAGVPVGTIRAAVGRLPVEPVELVVSTVERHGIGATAVEVRAPDIAATRTWADVRGLVQAADLPDPVRTTALDAFARLARAEAAVHRTTPDEVHFHEVGAVDSIVDVCGAAVALDLLGWPEVVALPPQLGQGFVKTAHGLLPVPPPAVLELLRGLPITPGGPVGEAVTPTGAALLAGLCTLGLPPPFTPRKIGYGVGTKRWPDRPNVLRMTLGEITAGSGHLSVFQLELNLDDCPGQLVARAIEAALEAGALDAWAAPCTMKKGRPGLVLAALAPLPRRDAVAEALLAETTSLGLRYWPVDRIELDRELVPVETEHGPVRVKVGRREGKVLSAHPEYEDCAARARERGVPVKEVMAAAQAAWRALRP